ncbi:enoyl-CoA hydratase/isomerase [Microbulbifer spongiae]|uniref:Enoyl-CoA hydratase/isomerase n=1 Tax=Microbulbifer spongiae TaxID=2944933 RepID=A0ABY9ECT2_9GAMM|nr:enoyl-CoA hydratase/isomerase [Microbulbifer sp. MI-G]WKD49175.1 enoyl-CoA hydratase/isomerase [Microbulbifer sp. MI-G]
MGDLSFHTIKARLDGDIGYLQIYRPEENNTINQQLVTECNLFLDRVEDTITVLVLEGLPEVFCFGADFNEINRQFNSTSYQANDPEPLYDLWLRLAHSPFVSIAHVRGKTNAGGVGFVAACDIVLSEESAVFSLSEMLFGVLPACVLPFLIRRIGFAKANYMTMMTSPISANRAKCWQLVDEVEANTPNLLRRHLLRLRRLSKNTIVNYKQYMQQLHPDLEQAKPLARKANMKTFSDINNVRKISRYIATGRFPWE